MHMLAVMHLLRSHALLRALLVAGAVGAAGVPGWLGEDEGLSHLLPGRVEVLPRLHLARAGERHHHLHLASAA